MAEKIFFNVDSIKLVKQFLMRDAEESRLEQLSHETQERKSENKAVPCRVPKHLLRIDQTIQNPNIPQVPSHGPSHYHSLDIDQKTQNPYIPQVLSLGPYHFHCFAVKDVSTVVSQLDEQMSFTEEASFKLKLKSAAAVFGRLGSISESDLEKTFQMIENMWPNFQSFYNLSITEGEKPDGFALMMVLDSFFLMHFLLIPNQGDQGVDIKCDILKLENQIPLFMLKFFLEKFQFRKNDKLAYSLSDLLDRACKQLSLSDLSDKPITPIRKQLDAAVQKEPHLLGCLHAIISPHLEIGRLRDKYPEPTRLQRISRFLNHYVLEKVCAIFFCCTRPAKESRLIKEYTAGQMAMAGIKFKYFFLLSDNIRFDAYSHTLYLPRMTVAPLQIEVLLCNLAALEFVDKKRRTTVTSFLRLMGNFIKTPDDVEMLKKSEVISYPAMLTNNDIAEIWNRMVNPFRSRASEQDKYHVEQLEFAINDWVMDNYHQTKVRIKISTLKVRVRKLYHEFHQQYLSKPWNVVALLVATVILAMNMVQAYCSLWECKSKKPK